MYGLIGKFTAVAGQRAWVFCAPGERGPFQLHGWFA